MSCEPEVEAAAELVSESHRDAQVFASLFASMPTWIHRRVETIEFIDDTYVRRHISVDLTLPEWVHAADQPAPAPAVVPIAFLRKAPLESLSVRDAAGAALPVLTTSQNGQLAVDALIEIARTSLENGGLRDPDTGAEILREQLRTIVFGTSGVGESATEDLACRLVGHRRLGMQLSALGAEYVDICRQFAANFIFAVPLDVPPAGRTIIKFEYSEPLRDSVDERGPREKIKDRMGWSASTYRFEIPGAAASGSFHVEVSVPDGVSICQGAIQSGGEPADVTNFFLSRRGRPAIHMIDGGDVREHKEAIVNLRASKDGWLRVALASSCLILILMGLAWIRIDELFDTTDAPAQGTRASSVDAAAVLLTVVAIAGALIVRLGEHALAARVLSWSRATALVAVASPFLGAYVLAFGPPAGISPGKVWVGLVLVNGLCSAALLGSYAGPGLVATPEDYVGGRPPRRRQR